VVDTPLVTYNTWFAYGTTITEDIILAEMDRATALGVELFVADAGWYADAGRENDSDFESGLGRLTADPDRFPSGLTALADHAHEAGMRFGLWVEPERVALDLLGEIGVREGWLATRDR
jgi:alpha-galactosidase